MLIILAIRMLVSSSSRHSLKNKNSSCFYIMSSWEPPIFKFIINDTSENLYAFFKPTQCVSSLFSCFLQRCLLPISIIFKYFLLEFSGQPYCDSSTPLKRKRKKRFLRPPKVFIGFY